MSSTQQLPNPRKVISGHGEFTESQLASPTPRNPGGRTLRGGSPQAKFNLPPGVKITFYAPPGAGLDNILANDIELGNPITKANVEMRQKDTLTIKEIPDPYPIEFSNQASVIDYTVRPPDRLTVKNGAYTVDGPRPLREIVNQLAREGFTDLHFACCGAAYSDRLEFQDLFPCRGHFVTKKGLYTS